MSRYSEIEELAKTLAFTCIVDLDGNDYDLIEVLSKCDVEIIAEQLHDAGYRKHLTPCDVCKYNPQSSGDGKPCSMCPACAKDEEEQK